MPSLTLIALTLAPSAFAAELPADPLETLRAGHPRLVFLVEDEPRVHAAIAEDPVAAQWNAHVVGRADAMLDQPVTEFEIIGPRLLGASRQVLDRVLTLGFVYRMTGDERYGRRAVDELAAAAEWPHWNPTHFLDVAELNHAFGIGYDWLQPVLGEHRDAIREAWVEKGLVPAQVGYRGEAWWSRCDHNWNQVCNGGNLIGALAVADEEPELAREIVSEAVRLLPIAMRSYAPDGGWAEGPGYWHYATRYNVYAVAALETALGTDFGLSEIEGFSAAGDFRLCFVGPTGRTFNYADAGDGAGAAEEMMWLARRFDKPLYAWQQRQRSSGSALDLIWFDSRGEAMQDDGEVQASSFRGVDVAFLRTSWQDPNAWWAGLKGGDNRANHSHLDLGTFVLDALGERWIFELGTDNYNLPGYFGNQRWEYYRLSTFGQNTLVIDGRNQAPSAKAPLVEVTSDHTSATATVDLTQAYPMTTRVLRSFTLANDPSEDGPTLTIIDEITSEKPVEVFWHAHTRAQVSCDGARAILEQGGKRLDVRILSPDGAVFEARSAAQEPPQATNEGVTRLTVALTSPVTEARVVVRFASIEPF